ncbi:hypothetical protein L1049_014059 [Liquidambar formosana]|uniref:Uncharacterized protein n=1 Tax=Liquidambar formosana TaxID=63359 RepID=A0AAP0RQB2_LIQFO
MPAMVVAVENQGEGDPRIPAKLTKQVLVCSIIAAFGGLMFGYDIGISGKAKKNQKKIRYSREGMNR